MCSRRAPASDTLKRMRRGFLICVMVAGAALVGQESGLFSVLKSNVHIGRQTEGLYLLPTEQLLRPWGAQMAIKGRPVDLALDSAKRLIAVLNGHSVIVMDAVSGAQLAENKAHSTSYTGIVFRPGDREV